MVASIDIAGRKIGSGEPCFIIAEAGVNHNGSLKIAFELVDVAARAGANAVKFQTFKAEKVISPYAAKAEYQMVTTDSNESQLDMARGLELSFDAFREVFAYCTEKAIQFISTPFDKDSADFLDECGVSVFKIASGEITNLPFLEYVGKKGKPMIVSTGMSYLGEVETAVRTIEGTGNNQFVLLHCVSNYPADPSDVNLRAMNTLAAAFNVPVGYSDHTMGIEVPIAAAALGACVIEKHFTLDRCLPGPDHRASLDARELSGLVQSIRIVEMSMGSGRKRPVPSESDVLAVARRSLVAAKDIMPGTRLREGLVAIKRPGTGLPSIMLEHILGKRAKVKIAAGTIIDFGMLS